MDCPRLFTGIVTGIVTIVGKFFKKNGESACSIDLAAKTSFANV